MSHTCTSVATTRCIVFIAAMATCRRSETNSVACSLAGIISNNVTQTNEISTARELLKFFAIEFRIFMRGNIDIDRRTARWTVDPRSCHGHGELWHIIMATLENIVAAADRSSSLAHKIRRRTDNRSTHWRIRCRRWTDNRSSPSHA